MSIWNTAAVRWFSDKLVTFSNYVWRKRKVAEQRAYKKIAPLDPPSRKRR